MSNSSDGPGIIALLALGLAVAGVVATVAYPEIRCAIGLKSDGCDESSPTVRSEPIAPIATDLPIQIATEPAFTRVIPPTMTEFPPTPIPVDTPVPPATDPPQLPTDRPPTDPPPTAVSLDTAAGTVLEVGDTWRQDELRLTLIRVRVDRVDLLFMDLVLENMGSASLPVEISRSDIRVVDNLGNSFAVSPVGMTSSSTHRSLVIRSGSDEGVGFYAKGNYLELGSTELVITVSISAVHDAKWRVPLAR